MNSTETQSSEIVPLPESSNPPPNLNPKPKPSKGWKTLLSVVSFLCLSVLAYCAPPGVLKPSMNITGTVYDKDTMQPLEGAYVLAVYNEAAVGMAGSGTWCVKTKGMYTGKDGSYSFPIEKFNNISPVDVFAIKPDFYFVQYDRPPNVRYGWHLKSTFASRHVYLKKQDKEKPEFGYGFGRCERPESFVAKHAAIAFLKLEYLERVRYRDDSRIIKSLESTIVNMETEAPFLINKN